MRLKFPLGELFHADADGLLGDGPLVPPPRTIILTEPPWPTDPNPAAAGAWEQIAPYLSGFADRLVVLYGHRTDPRWVLDPVDKSLAFIETKWLECRHPGGQLLTAAELVTVFGRESWPCGPSVLTDSISRDTRPSPRSCGIGHARRVVELCVPEGWTVLDPFCGSGTFLVAAAEVGRRFIGVDHDADAVEFAETRLQALQE